MPVYTVEDTQTGRRVTFEWDGDAPPTDADMEQIFSSAGLRDNAQDRVGGGVSGTWDSALVPGATPLQQGAGIVDTLTTAYRNIGPSASYMVKGIKEAVTHPIEAVNAAARLATGVLHEITPGEQGKEEWAAPLIERYGSLEAAQRTFAEDPIGFLSDVASIVSGGGALKAGRAVEPINIAQRAVTAPAEMAGRALRRGAESAMMSTIKTTRRTGRGTWGALRNYETAKQIARTALDKGIFVSEGGIAKLEDLSSHLSDMASDIIKNRDLGGKPVSLKKAFGRTLNELRSDFKKAGYQEGVKQIDRFEKNMVKEFGDTIPAEAADEIRRKLDKFAQHHFGEFKFSGTEVRKQAARGIKEELFDIFPELRSIRKEHSEIIRLQKALEEAVYGASRRQLVSLKAMLAASGMKDVGPIGKAAYLTLLGIDKPRVKSLLAHALNKTGKFARKVRPKDVEGILAGRLARAAALEDEQQPEAGEGPQLGEFYVP